MKATLCEKWELPLHFDLSDQGDIPEKDRSYVHYLTTRPHWISTKALTFEWLISDLGLPGGLSAIEYMAGLGIETLIIDNILKPDKKRFKLLDWDQECVNHLTKLGYDAHVGDAKKTMLDPVYQDYDMKFFSVPFGSTIHSIRKNWKGWEPMFDGKTQLITWVDTGCAYPISRNSKLYANHFGKEDLSSWEDYVLSYSDWLYETKGYSIKKAGWRGTNAVFFAATIGKSETEFKRFKFKECGHGLVIT